MVLSRELRRWSADPARDRDPSAPPDASSQLEAGDILLFPQLAFDVLDRERAFLSPDVASAKNVSFDPSTDRLGGATVTGREAVLLAGLLGRFSEAAAELVATLLPSYAPRIQRARASFRPAEIAHRPSSWRQDDSRLHVDSFPATPVQSRRILRVFTNVNPHGRMRQWRIGEDFERVARRFLDRLRLPWPGSATVLRLVRLTKSRRSPYDALMLQLHDRMKADLEYQASVPATVVDFAPGSTWMAFTDQVSHAAISGQHQLEQTFLLPVEAMNDPARSPLRILERLKGRPLV